MLLWADLFSRVWVTAEWIVCPHSSVDLLREPRVRLPRARGWLVASRVCASLPLCFDSGFLLAWL